MAQKRPRSRYLPRAAAAFCLLLAPACILEESHHSLYLEPDGAVTWVVLQRDIRSDHADPAERLAEEGRFLQAFRDREGGVAGAFCALGGTDLRTELLRDRRPFVAFTEARFASIATLAERFFRLSEVPVTATLEKAGAVRHLTVTLRAPVPEGPEEGEAEGAPAPAGDPGPAPEGAPDPDGSAEPDSEDGPGMTALVASAESYRIVLTEGTFLDARGFTLADKDTAAVLDESLEERIDALEESGGELVLSLSWTAALTQP